MSASLIDRLTRPRVFARVVASATAAASRALADGVPVGVWQDGVLLWQHPDGRREQLSAAPGEGDAPPDRP